MFDLWMKMKQKIVTSAKPNDEAFTTCDYTNALYEVDMNPDLCWDISPEANSV